MICVLAFSTNDVRQAIELLEWIVLLADGQKHHRILLVADAAVGWVDGVKAIEAAGKAFERAELITNKEPVTGWPAGPNSLFFTAANYIHRFGEGWVWLEPDSLPLRSGWLDDLEAAYQAAKGKDFVGHIYTNSKPEFPRRLMSGVAMYSPQTKFVLFEVQAVAWDMHHADLMVAKGAHTPLIYHFYGEKDLPPTFAEFKTVNSPINEMVLENIPKEAVIFHRCKNSSLLNLLRKKQFPEAQERFVAGGGLLAVIAFCGKDLELALQNVKWMAELNGTKNFPCLLSYDEYTQRTHIAEIRKVAEQAFGEVRVHPYRARTDLGWPGGANEAFKATARFVEANYKIPWLWIEADATPMKPSWLMDICQQYYQHGKSFYGPIVPERNHLNGVCVYPWNAASRLHRAMAATGLAWDYICRPDMGNDVADAEPIICHIWGWHENRAHPHAGDPIRFSSVGELNRWVPKSAALLHRNKYAHTIGLIRERLKSM